MKATSRHYLLTAALVGALAVPTLAQSDSNFYR